MPDSLYNRDFYAWTKEQADALRREALHGNNAPIDWENIAEELESLGRSDWNELESRLAVLLVHLLKLMYVEEQRDRNARQWRLSINEQRRMIPKRLKQSPSLSPVLRTSFPGIYAEAVEVAAEEAEVDLSRFPAEPPFTLDQALDRAYPEHLVPPHRRPQG